MHKPLKPHKNPLNNNEKKKLKKMPKFKLIRRCIKIYNRLCNKCKPMATQDPRSNIEKYCDDCKEVINNLLGDL